MISWLNLDLPSSSAHAVWRYWINALHKENQAIILLIMLYIMSSSTLVQVVFSDVYMLDEEMKWKVMPPMPKPDSHIEFAWKVVNNSIVIVGGTTEKHPETKKMVLVGEIFQFNLNTLVKCLKPLCSNLSKICVSLMILVFSTEMVCDWEITIPCENNTGWILGRTVILHFRTKRQRSR